LALAKYLGEGTSRKKAEEKSSAFFILRHFVVGKWFGKWLLLPDKALAMTQNVISDAERRTLTDQERGRDVHFQGLSRGSLRSSSPV
jgi:hypothetical protein